MVVLKIGPENTRKKRINYRKLALIFLISTIASNCWGADTFDYVTGYLTIPKVVVGDGRTTSGAKEYTDIKVVIEEVVSFGQISSLSATNISTRPDTYDTHLNQLLVPQVIVENNVYSDVVVTIGTIISFTGTVTEIGSPAYSQGRSLQPFFYSYTDDIPKNLRDLWQVGIESAASFFGRYGPLELWMQGASDEGLITHKEKFCERRKIVGLPYPTNESCISDAQRKFGEYQQKSKNSQLGAGVNGDSYRGYHLIISAYPGWFDEKNWQGARGFLAPFHEYFHVVQHAHISNLLNHSERDSLMGPIWFVEGTASAMADYAVSTMQSNESLQLVNDRSYDFFDHKALHLSLARKQWQELDNPKLGLTYEEMRPTFYSNSWAADLLLSRTRYDILESSFYPDLMKKGWEQSFVDTFDMSSNDFYVLYAKFMAKKPEEQMSILPGWDGLTAMQKDTYITQASWE